LLVLCQRKLDLVSATSRCHSRHETRHDAVPGVLDLAAARCGKSISDDPVMDRKKGHGSIVPEALRERSRAYDIREQDGPDTRVALDCRAAGKDSGARWIDFCPPPGIRRQARA
jgi:hypothetical protein